MARQKTTTEPRNNGHAPKRGYAELTASAQRIDPGNRLQAAALRKAHAKWQDEVWELFDVEPTVAAPHRYIGNAMSRVRPYAAFRPDPNAEPVPLDPDDENQINDGLAPIAIAARAEIDRIAGPLGTAAPIMGALAFNIALVGEANLYATVDPLTGLEEWEVLSTRELRAKDDGWYLFTSDGDNTGQKIDDNDLVIRIWRRHPKFRKQADAPMRSLVDAADQLLLLQRAIKVSTMSRLSAGFLKLPTGLSFVQRITDPADGQASDDPLIRDLIDAMVTPVMQPDSAAALVPLIVQGDADGLKEFGLLNVDRGLSEEQIKLREELRKIMGIGLDLPMEILLGLADTNHWSAWQIDEQTFKAYLEPLAMVLCSGLTTGFLQPALREQGFDPTNIVVWYDAQELVGDPDNFDHAERLHQAFTVSDAFFRRAGGASDEDAPDEEELLRRIDQTRGRVALDQGPITSPQTEGPPGSQNQTPKGPPAQDGTKEPVAASAVRRGDVSTLGPKLAEIDRNLQRRVLEWADAAIRSLLRQADAKLRVRLHNKDRRAFDRYRNRDVLDYCREIGPEGLIAAGIAEAELLDNEIADLEDRYRQATRRAFLAALTAAQKAANKKLSREETDDLLVKHERNVDNGFAFLTAAIVSTARYLLFQPAPAAPQLGEHDNLTLIPAGAVRESLAQAGGATSARPDDETGQPSGLVATGELSMDTFERDLALTPNAYEWDYGDPSARTTAFEPHEALDGVQFLDWTDEQLTNVEPFPDTSYFWPGDHDGCGCNYIPIFGEGE